MLRKILVCTTILLVFSNINKSESIIIFFSSVNTDFDTSFLFVSNSGLPENNSVLPKINIEPADIQFQLMNDQEQVLPLGELASPEANFIQRKLLDLIFPGKENFNADEIDFLRREVFRWENKGYSMDELALKFEIRKAIYPIVKNMLFSYLPDAETLSRLELNEDDFLVSMEQRELLYETVEKFASKIEIKSSPIGKAEGVIPFGISLDNISTRHYVNIVNYFHKNGEYIIDYDLSGGDFNAIWNIIKPQNMNKIGKISFLVKHPSAIKITENMRIEFDKEGTPNIDPVSVILKDVATIKKIDEQWDEVSIDMQKVIENNQTAIDWQNVNVFSIVFKKGELEAAGIPLAGEIVLKDVYFQPKDKQLEDLAEAVRELEVMRDNKKFLENASIPFVLPSRPLVLTVDDDRKIFAEFNAMVKKNMEEKIKNGIEENEAASIAREEEWQVLSSRLIEPQSPYQAPESLYPFLSEYLGEQFDLRRKDHKGIWDWYTEQLVQGASVGDLKKRLAIGIVLKPYVEKLAGVNISNKGLQGQLHEFALKNRSYRFLKDPETLPNFLKEVLRAISVNYFFKPKENGGTRDAQSGLSYDSDTGKNLSIAATGFQLTYLPMSIEYNWLVNGDKEANMEYGYSLAKGTLETIAKMLRELSDYENFLTQYLSSEVKNIAASRGIDIYQGSPQGKVLNEEEIRKLHAYLDIEEELRAQKEPEILKAYLEEKGIFDSQAASLYYSDSASFLREYSPIYKYGRYGMLYRYFVPAKLRGEQDPGNDAGTIDNAILDWGIKTLGNYFKDYNGLGDGKGYLKKLADEILGYRKWSYFVNTKGDAPNIFNMGWQISDPGQNNRGFYPYSWDVYTDEQLLINIMAVASKKYPVSSESYYAFKREKDAAGFIRSGTNSAFTFHLADIWFDKRNLTDKNGDNWYKNTILATLANRDFTLAQAKRFSTLDGLHFLFSTGYTPGLVHDFWDRTKTYEIEGYLMRNGFNARFTTPIMAVNGFAGASLHSIYALLGLAKLPIEFSRIWSEKGFVDSYSLDEGRGYTKDHYWVSSPRVGFSEGIFATLFNLLGEINEEKRSIWDITMNDPDIKTALSKMGLEKESPPTISFDSLQPNLFTGIPQEESLAKMRMVADIASGKVYQDARTFEAIKYFIENLDKEMEVKYELMISVPDLEEQVKYYALAIAAQRNTRDYFAAKETFNWLRDTLARAKGAEQERLADIAARIIYKYDLFDGEFSGRLSLDEIQNDILTSPADKSRIVSSTTVESELGQERVILDPKLPADSGFLGYYIDQVYEKGNRLSDIVSWILTYIKINSEI